MAEVVAEGVVQGYTERPWEFADERTGEMRKGISRKLKVRLDEPGSGTLIVKVPEDLADEAEAIEVKSRVRVTLDLDPKMNVSVTAVDAVASY